MEKLQYNKDITSDFGLTNSQIEQRLKAGQVNNLMTKTSKSYTKILISNICTWFNFLCFVIAGMLIAVGSFSNLLFLFIFLANLAIGLIQEIRAKRKVDSINVINQTKVTTIREGCEVQVEPFNVVQDDVLIIRNGDQICADCVLLEGCLEVNESLLTGESKPITKQAGDTLLGGSYVISGVCRAIATKIGMATYSASLIKKAREYKDSQSDILKTLNLIIKIIGLLLLPLGVLTFLDTYYSGAHNIVQAIERTSGSIIGMMPVGMFLLTSVSLVVGVLNLAKKKTLVQDLYSIEMLARANVLCLDKTGTLTDGTMTVTNITPIGKAQNEINDIMCAYVKGTKTSNATSQALCKCFTPKDEKIKSIIEFSSERKFSAITFENLGTFTLGAPEFVTNKLDKTIKDKIQAITQEGFRVLLLCECPQEIKKNSISKDNTPIAIITIQDNIRPDAKDTINWFNQNDVAVKIISGDNVDTVSNIAKKVGVPNYDKCISLENLTDDEVSKIANEYSVFGRVSPEQKCLIIKALKLAGNKVAMTGDGVNDILALKECDCSIAMASGSEATRSASNLVMLEDNFSAMPSIVTEGRRVINNISSASSLFLNKTFFTMFLTIFVLISTTYDYPLQPNQILLWETLFVGIPAFFLALQPNKERIKGTFLASLTSKTIPGALVLFLGAMACYIYCGIINQPQLITTLISYTATFGAFFILLNLCMPLDKFRTAITSSMLVACVIILLVIPKTFFKYAVLDTQNLIFIAIIVVAINCLYLLLKFLFEKLFKSKKKVL